MLFVVSVTAQERPSDPETLVRTELVQQGFHTEDLQDLVIKDQYRTAHNGLRHTFFRQRWQGIEVWNADIAVHQATDGRVVKLNNGAWSGLAKRVNGTSPALNPEAALALVLNKDGVKSTLPALRSTDAARNLWSYDGTDFSGEPVTVQLVFQPMNLSDRPQVERLLLAWNVTYAQSNGLHWWNVRIDANTGAELDRNDWVSQCAFDLPHGEGDLHEHTAERPDLLAPAPAAPNDYRVLPLPVESPSHGTRAIRNAPWTAGGIASPFGWHDNNGVAGAEFTITRGNNVRACEDADANNTPGYSPNGGATLDFDFPLDLTQAPSTYQNAAITNLFYWNNLMHDVWYPYGFDEPSGNFQSNNYGRGGTGNDFVNADAQDGSGTNNANFGTPPDGSSPRMQMFIWTAANPDRDSDLDNGVIAHEYGHGISNRLVGGPSNTNCLGNAEQMGEGWSDYFGLMMTIEPGDLAADGRGIGTYVQDQPVTGGGIRPAPYSTSFSVNNYTYANTNSGVSQPHGIGFVWCTMLWEMTWDLIAQYGFDPDIYNGNGGNNIAMQLVIDGLKLTPCNPGFVDARNAILQADVVNNAGANQNLIWAAFARRGLGVSAAQGSSASRSDQIEAFDTPMPNNIGISAVLDPAPGLLFDCAANGLTVRATVRNYGQSAQTGFPVRYQLDGGALVTETFTGTLAQGAAVTYVFATPLTITGNGAHTLVVSTALAGDGGPSNDAFSAVLTLTATTTVTTPYLQNVDAGVVTPAGWFLQNPDNSTTWGTTALTNGPACTATTAWSINNFSYNAPGQQDRLISPVIDLSGSGASRLKFDHSYALYSTSYADAMRVEVSANCGSTWTEVFYAVGSALATAPTTTSNYTPSSCSQWQANDLDISAFDGQDILVRFSAINDYGNWLYLDNVQVVANGLATPIKLMLEGPYDQALGRMKDDLRTAALLPATEPFTALGFTQAGGGGGETLLPAALTITGDNAIVDWVLVELRDAVTPSTIVATRSALVQRDGDVVGMNGTSPVVFTGAPGNYHRAVRHRNHLGTMTSVPVPLGQSNALLDLTLPGTVTYGTEARKNIGGVMALWTGNVVANTQLQYTGSGNDRDPILLAIGGSVPTSTISGYRVEDTNLDGVVKYTGSANDRDMILLNIGGSIPTSIRLQQLP